MSKAPKIDDAPGLKARPRAGGKWALYWVPWRKGYNPKSVLLWQGVVPTAAEASRIRAECKTWQQKMLEWVDGTTLPVDRPVTISDLINRYSRDPESPYRTKRPDTRRSYDEDLNRLDRAVGEAPLAEIIGQDIRRWYEEFRKPRKPGGPERVRLAHGVMVMLNMLFGYGKSIERPDQPLHCARLRSIMEDMRFTNAPARKSRVTLAQAKAIIEAAHAMGRPSIALAQAMQFELTLRQRDVIGEWIDRNDPELSAVHDHGQKWVRGVRWEQISERGILKHTTSKKGTLAEFNINLYPLVVAEIARVPVERRMGPMIVCEASGLPYRRRHFARLWRRAATAAGVPSNVWNMDSRAGGVTEATDAGAGLEDVRHHAQHSNVAITQRYSRQTLEKTSRVAQLRVKHRDKSE